MAAARHVEAGVIEQSYVAHSKKSSFRKESISPMIVSRIEGGLGNQMFQYAYGLYLARQHNTQHILDVSSYNSQTSHGLLLDRFQIQSTFADFAVRSRYPRQYRKASKARWWEAVFEPRAMRRVRQRPFGFRTKYLSACNDSFLDGYWQSELFFPGMREALLEHFRPVDALRAETQRVQEEMLGTNSIAVHVRRGDYLSNPVNAQLYCQLDAAYYRTCVDDWAKYRPNSKVFVFSNDLRWCRDNLQLNLPTRYIEHTGPRTAHEDLLMIGQAACCITANSTFSWWGAWLNNRTDKVVYAPRQWFQAGALDDRDIPSTDWITVDLTQQHTESLHTHVESASKQMGAHKINAAA